VKRLDLCADVGALPDNSFDLILHNHVLQLFSWNIETVLCRLDRVLSPGGIHLFSVPMRVDLTIEDTSPDLSPKELLKRFEQEDHLRIFGVFDVTILLNKVRSQEAVMFDFRNSFDEEYLNLYGIPPDSLTRPTSSSMFIWRKPE
jgi:ubiquinone/menaquinone biosynthesis C-methylase UbiE